MLFLVFFIYFCTLITLYILIRIQIQSYEKQEKTTYSTTRSKTGFF